MKKLLLVTFTLILSINLFAQFPEVTIYDIQYQPDILTTGDQPSPLDGDTVTVTGVVMVSPYRNANPDSNVILIAGAPAIYLQDTSETDWAGILVRDPTNSPAFSFLDSGTVVKVSGVVSEFFVTTQLNVVQFEGSNVIGFMDRPEPVLLTLDSLAELGSNIGKLLAERWEGVYVEVRNVTATNPGAIGSGSFEIFDANNTQVIVGNQSSYFRNDIPAPQAGTQLEYVRGYIQNRDNLPQGYGHIIMPAYPNDVKVATFPPVISDVTRNIAEVGSGDQVTVSATIVDPDGTVSDAKLHYRHNETTSGVLTMTNPSGDIWNATIPGFNDSSLVDYYIIATDDSGNVAVNPSDTTRNRYFYLVLDRPLTIKDVQFSPFGGGFSGYNGFTVALRGIVTADTTDIKGDGSNTGVQVYMQDGAGPWSGISIFGTEADDVRRGDDITVTGPVTESFGITRLGTTSDPVSIVTNGTNQPIPEPELITTDDIDFITSGSVQAEQWEGVLVKYQDVTVTDENADGLPGPDEGSGGNRNFGEILVMDAVSTHETRVELQDGAHSYHNFWQVGMDTIPTYIRQGDTFDELIGILWYSFGNYKLLPRKDDDFVGYVSDVEEITEQPREYELAQNYPNPFNPSTKIQYALPVEGNVTLKVYNILGQQVRTLIDNQLLPAGRHEVTFDAANLPSGLYIYRLQTNNFVDVKKMMLLK